MQIEYSASQAVQDTIGALGRTEDVRLSPNNRRMVIAGFVLHRVTVFDINMTTTSTGPRVELTGAVVLSSPAFKKPHGLDFIDDDTLIVANREGDVAIFELPPEAPGSRSLEVQPIQTWRADDLNLVASPGSLAVAQTGPDGCEILVCNNYVHTVTRHQLDLRAGAALPDSKVLLRKWLRIPDGVTVSHDRKWIAISNHETHGVMLYENLPSLDEQSDPACILRGVNYPHGIRFSADDRRLFVADAGAPSIHIYERGGDGWCGVRRPDSTVQILDDALFLRGQINPAEGGPKGLDISSDSNVLVVTTEFQPLAFYDLPAMIERESTRNARSNGVAGGEGSEGDEGFSIAPMDQSALDIHRELAVMDLEVRAQRAEARVRHMTGSLSWRVTAPLRSVRTRLPGGRPHPSARALEDE